MSRTTALLRVQVNFRQNSRCGARIIYCTIFHPAKIIFNGMKEIHLPRRI